MMTTAQLRSLRVVNFRNRKRPRKDFRQLTRMSPGTIHLTLRDRILQEEYTKGKMEMTWEQLENKTLWFRKQCDVINSLFIFL
jgi:hypothetical protein